jgi:hypothetical protein
VYFIYADEHDCDQEKYSAAIALVFPVSKISGFRFNLISRIREIFQRSETDASPFPVLHASSLPDLLEDSKKVELFAAVIEEASKVCIGIYRVGYHWNDSHLGIFGKKEIEAARLASFTTLQHELTQLPLNPNVIVQEYDESRHRRSEPWLNRTENLEQLTQLQLLGQKFESHLSGNIGYYYASKQDYQMYAVDFVAYYLKLLQRERTSNFQGRLIAAASKTDMLIVRNEIVPMR